MHEHAWTCHLFHKEPTTRTNSRQHNKNSAKLVHTPAKCKCCVTVLQHEMPHGVATVSFFPDSFEWTIPTCHRLEMAPRGSPPRWNTSLAPSGCSSSLQRSLRWEYTPEPIGCCRPAAWTWGWKNTTPPNPNRRCGSTARKLRWWSWEHAESRSLETTPATAHAPDNQKKLCRKIGSTSHVPTKHPRNKDGLGDAAASSRQRRQHGAAQAGPDGSGVSPCSSNSHGLDLAVECGSKNEHTSKYGSNIFKHDLDIIQSIKWTTSKHYPVVTMCCQTKHNQRTSSRYGVPAKPLRMHCEAVTKPQKTTDHHVPKGHPMKTHRWKIIVLHPWLWRKRQGETIEKMNMLKNKLCVQRFLIWQKTKTKSMKINWMMNSIQIQNPSTCHKFKQQKNNKSINMAEKNYGDSVQTSFRHHPDMFQTSLRQHPNIIQISIKHHSDIIQTLFRQQKNDSSIKHHTNNSKKSSKHG